MKRANSPLNLTLAHKDTSRHVSSKMSSLKVNNEKDKCPDLMAAFADRYNSTNTLKHDAIDVRYDIFNSRKCSEHRIGPSLPSLVTTAKNFNKSNSFRAVKLRNTQLNFAKDLPDDSRSHQFNILNTRQSQAGNTTKLNTVDKHSSSHPLLTTLQHITDENAGGCEFGRVGQKKLSLHQAIDQFMEKRGGKRNHASLDMKWENSHENQVSHKASNYASGKLPMPQSIEEVELRIMMGSDDNKHHMIDADIFSHLKSVETSYLDRHDRSYMSYGDPAKRQADLLSKVNKVTKKQANERKDAKTLITWFNSLADYRAVPNLDELTAFVNAQSSLCCFAFNELASYLNTTCKDYSAYLRLIHSQHTRVINRLLAYVSVVLQNTDRRRIDDCRLMADRAAVNEHRLGEDIDKLRSLVEQKNAKIEEQRRLIASMRSKLYNDYLVIRGLKQEADFTENKLDVVQDENNKITKIISDLGDAAVVYVYM